MERIRPNAPAPAPNNGGGQAPASRASHGSMPGTPSLASKILVIVLIIASVVFIASMFVQLFTKPVTSAAKANKDQYQAVFLTNGQVYFGKIDNTNSGYVTLQDIFYLQVTQTNAETALQDENSESVEQPQISLAKLGNELHGPEDEMFINRDQILFWENLKDSGQVSKAIADFEKNGGDGADASLDASGETAE